MDCLLILQNNLNNQCYFSSGYNFILTKNDFCFKSFKKQFAK